MSLKSNIQWMVKENDSYISNDHALTMIRNGIYFKERRTQATTEILAAITRELAILLVRRSRF